jgi:L-fucose isomerase-like protein
VIRYLEKTAKIRPDVSREDLLTVSKMYLALQKLCEEKDFEAINVKCQYELSKEFGMVACVPLSILAENSIVAACEGDILVTVSMLILHYLSGSITAYADVININEEGTIKLSPCGFIPYSLGEGSKSHKEIRNFMPGAGFKGIQNSFVFKTGKVTILRLVEDIGNYHIIYTTGEGLPTELRQGCMPALDIRIDGSIEKMIDNFAGQHYALCYGDLSKEIEEISRILGIECIRF